MDLSKAFDTINHELLIAKLHAYGFDKNALKLIFSYISDRWQRTKINLSFSSWSELLQGVPQGSVLGPILFNIYLNGLLYFLHCDICNFADDTAPFVCDKDLEFVISQLEEHSQEAINWFENNYIKMNSDKCHFLISGHKHEQLWAKIGNDKIWETRSVELLGVTIDNDLKFDEHLLKIFLKANRKLSALTRIKKYLDFHKIRVLFKAFFESQFKHCSLTWMFHSRKTNKQINQLHERALRLIYNNYELTFEELLDKDGSFCVHHFNIQTLAIELYEVYNNLSESIFSDLFTRNTNNYNLRTTSDFLIPQINTVLKGSNSIQYFGSKIWNVIPPEIKYLNSFESFKKSIRKWKPINCPCRICKTYLPNVGFVETFE